MIHTALSVAGSDPSGGAGIQADLKTFAAHGVYGMAALTALTAQNTLGVSAVHAAPPAFVAEQLRMVRADLPLGAVKTGMLFDAPTIEAVVGALEGLQAPLVVDPVMVATSGHVLLQDDAIGLLLEQLVPRATLVTPNLAEARLMISGDPGAWARSRGVALLLKDGHGHEPVVRDRLYLPEGGVRVFEHPRVDSRNTHGTGCTLSAAIAARLAWGEGLEAAVEGAIAWLAGLIARSAGPGLGGGHGPLLHHLARATR